MDEEKTVPNVDTKLLTWVKMQQAEARSQIARAYFTGWEHAVRTMQGDRGFDANVQDGELSLAWQDTVPLKDQHHV